MSEAIKDVLDRLRKKVEAKKLEMSKLLNWPERNISLFRGKECLELISETLDWFLAEINALADKAAQKGELAEKENARRSLEATSGEAGQP